MLFNEWNVLLVDDEPDVLAVTKLSLRDVEVYGLPIEFHTAASKDDAIEVINDQLLIPGVPGGKLAIAMIDVVMHTQHDGLELCNYIREDMNNKIAQLFIRTGQPGLAPERKVIDEYDISGYFTKVETTESRLYSIVKSGIRQWYAIYYANLMADFTNFMIAQSESKQQILDTLAPRDESFKFTGNVTGIIFDGDTVSSAFEDERVYQLRDELNEKSPMFVTSDGHKLIIDGTRMMIHVRETETTADYCYVAESRLEMPDALLQINFRNSVALATLWKRAK